MLIEHFMEIKEMAKPAKICEKCGKSMSKYHYWYQGGWKCKSAATQEAVTKKTTASKTTTRKSAEVNQEKGESDEDFASRWFKSKEEAVKKARKEEQQDQDKKKK